MFLMVYDGATILVSAEDVQDKEEPKTMSLMAEYFEKYRITLTVVVVIVADQAFMTPSWRPTTTNTIKPVATSPGRPWPNPAEAAASMLKHQLKLNLQTIKDGSELSTILS